MKIRWLAAAGFGAATVLAFAGPTLAQDGVFPAGGWQHRQIGLGETAWSDATAGGIVDAGTVDLTKPDATTGVSLETTNLDLKVSTGDVISVTVELKDGAATNAGAVRLFYYDSADADTLAVAPTAFVAATGDGTLELSVVADGTVGTLGLVYDASNVSAGTVRFSGLEVAGAPVLFEEPAPPASPTPTPAPSPTLGTDESPPPGAAGGLPVTGSKPLWIGGVGAGLLLAGGGALLLTRRRRVNV